MPVYEIAENPYNRYSAFVKAFSRRHPGMSGPDLFKAAGREWRGGRRRNPTMMEDIDMLSSNPRVKAYSFMRGGKRVRVPSHTRGKKRRRNPENPRVSGYSYRRDKKRVSVPGHYRRARRNPEVSLTDPSTWLGGESLTGMAVAAGSGIVNLQLSKAIGQKGALDALVSTAVAAGGSMVGGAYSRELGMGGGFIAVLKWASLIPGLKDFIPEGLRAAQGVPIERRMPLTVGKGKTGEVGHIPASMIPKPTL